MWQLLVSPVAKIVGDVIKRVLPPEKMDEESRVRLEQELKLTVMEYDWSELEAEIQDRADARALAQKELDKGNAFTNVLAALHRPTWSFVMLGLFVASVLDKALGLPEIVLGQAEQEIMRTVIIFYFGGRSVEKAINIVKNGSAPKLPLPKLQPAPPPRRPLPPKSQPTPPPRRQEPADRENPRI